MKKRWVVASIFLVIILSGVASFLVYSKDMNGPTGQVIYQNDSDNQTEYEDNYAFAKDKFHWGHMPVTYSYGEKCIGPIIKRIEWVFEDIKNRTENLVTLEEVEGEADINFICSPNKNVRSTQLGPGHYMDEYTYGLTTPSYYEDENLLINADIEFWSVSENMRPASCALYPSLEAHEILHTFGFDHSDDSEIYSVMYALGGGGCIARDDLITRNGETFYPEDKIDDEIISCLKYIYSNRKEGSCVGVNMYN